MTSLAVEWALNACLERSGTPLGAGSTAREGEPTIFNTNLDWITQSLSKFNNGGLTPPARPTNSFVDTVLKVKGKS